MRQAYRLHVGAWPLWGSAASTLAACPANAIGWASHRHTRLTPSSHSVHASAAPRVSGTELRGRMPPLVLPRARGAPSAGAPAARPLLCSAIA